MTPKRLRLIAQIIRNFHKADQGSRNAIAHELEAHAAELEYLGWTVEEPKPLALTNCVTHGDPGKVGRT